MSLSRMTPIDAEIIANAIFQHGLAKLKAQSPTLFTLVCQHREEIVKAIGIAKQESLHPDYVKFVKKERNGRYGLSLFLTKQAD